MTYEVSFAPEPLHPFGILRRAPGNGWNLFTMDGRYLDTVYLSRDTAAGALRERVGATDPTDRRSA